MSDVFLEAIEFDHQPTEMELDEMERVSGVPFEQMRMVSVKQDDTERRIPLPRVYPVYSVSTGERVGAWIAYRRASP